MAATSVEERLTAIETELEQIKRQLTPDKLQAPLPWWQQISGVFKDCLEFDEAMRLGREWRESQRMEYDDTEATGQEHGSA